MRGVLLVVVAVVTVWLEASFLGALRPFGLLPNLILILLLAGGVALAASETVALAVGMGLMLDLASGADFGLRTAFFSLLALLIVVLKRSGADFERLSMVVAAVAGGTVLYNAAVIASLVVGHVSLPWAAIASRVGAETVLNIALAIVLVRPLIWGLRQLGQPFGRLRSSLKL